jgi:hypothetical protein
VDRLNWFLAARKKMRRVSLCSIALATIALVWTTGSAHAQTFSDWRASQAAPDGQFSDVSIVGPLRVFAGSEVDAQTFALTATLYTTSGNPGSSPATKLDLGLTTHDSFAISVASDRAGGYWAAASENILPTFDARSYIFASGALGSPIPVIGPLPGSDPDVVLNAINRYGFAVGTVGESTPLVSTSAGVTTLLAYPHAAALLGVDDAGIQIAGTAVPSAGAPFVATVFSATGAIFFQDDTPGEAWDVEGNLAVGQRDGYAAYWQRGANGWHHRYIESPPGTPLAGALYAIDHGGHGIAGGVLEMGRPVLIDLHTREWLEIEPLLPVAPGTLWRVVGVDVDSNGWKLALAVEAADFTGWDVTASLAPRLPGPGLWLAPALLLTAIPAGKMRLRR